MLSGAAAYGHFYPLLAHAEVVVGSGSILATFAAGLPTLLVPQGADQFEIAGTVPTSAQGLS